MLKPIKGQPGRFLETGSGQILNISEYREDDKYDTIVIYSDNFEHITAGTQYVFFRDVEKKFPIDTNLTQPSRLSMGEEMVVDRVGASVDLYAGEYSVANSDFGQVVFNGHLRVNVNNLLLAEGPLVKFASGYGLTGSGIYHTGDNLAGVSNTGIFVNIGVPSQAAVPKLVRTQTLTEKHEFIGYLSFFSRAWMDRKQSQFEVGMAEIEYSSVVPVKCWLHGLLKVAINK
jgi:hypothetical protein